MLHVHAHNYSNDIIYIWRKKKKKSHTNASNNLENSARIDFVENVAENEAIAECKAEVFLGRFFGE